MERFNSGKQEQMDPADPVPEDAPIVSFDINLGKNMAKLGYTSIDFDYGEFFKTHEDISQNENNIPRMLEVNIGKNEPGYGYYYPFQNKIEVSEKAILHKKQNFTLSHELKHHDDFLNGELKIGDHYELGARATQLSQRASKFAVAAYAGLILSEHNEKLGAFRPALEKSALYSTLAVAGTYAIGWALYKNDPVEKRANKAAKKHKRDIINLKRRPLFGTEN